VCCMLNCVLPSAAELDQCDISRGQELVSCLQVLQVVAPAMHSSLHSQVTSLLPDVFLSDLC